MTENDLNKQKKEIKLESIVRKVKRTSSGTNMVKERARKFKRIPIKDQKSIGIKQDPGYFYRLVNDVGDRITKFKNAGYEHVKERILEGEERSKDAKQVGSVASQSVGGGITGYYMRIDADLYKADQLAKKREIDDRISNIAQSSIDSAIKKYKSKNSSASNFHGKIKIDDELITEVDLHKKD